MSTERKGKLIIVDGVDGVGKTTLIDYLKLVMKDNDNIVYVRDQYIDDPVCASIKQIIINYGSEMDTECAAMLSIASRVVLNKVIKSYMEQGKTVICDRYLSSTLILNADTERERLNIKTISQIISNGYIKPDTYVILRYKDTNKAKKPTDSMEARLKVEESQKRYDNLSSILENVVYVDIDHDNESVIDSLKNILKVLSIHDEFRNSKETIDKFLDSLICNFTI